MSDWGSARVPPDAFVRELWAEVERHPAVAHPFLRRFAEGGLAPWQIWGYASQHYRLVGSFTAYLEAIAGRTGMTANPSEMSRFLIARGMGLED